MGENKLGSWFVTKRRDDKDPESTFVSLKEGAPDWLQEAIHEAHHTDLPNDWIYAECEAACDAIDEGSIKSSRGGRTDDGIHEHADARVDVYTRALYQWSADMCHSYTWSYAEERADEFGSDSKETEKRIGLIQFCAIETIAQAMLAAWEENQDEEEEEAKVS